MAIATHSIEVERLDDIIGLFGSFDENIRLVEQHLQVNVTNRETQIRITGDLEQVAKAAKVVEGLLGLVKRGETVDKQRVMYLIMLVSDGEEAKIDELGSDVICVTAKGRPVKGKTVGQKNYINTIKKNTVTLAVGPAGTGKTYLAVAMAVGAFRDKQINRIILTRPAVEAGEKLGFLPGDLQNKVDPYLRPLYDALFDMLGAETYQRYLERGNIEVAPLAFMRGRTLDDSFIILDEAQNTTSEQMKMFLTRLGFNSRVVVTGDVTQTDLPDGKSSGLREALRILRGIEGIGISELSDKDIVRHELVGRIIKAYDNQKKRD
ncbi:MAG: PhoH family protein [Clostridia bacterium]|nr:PhoH family protein [Clostridia bacterium]